jgi:trans-AT polyketide synthase/acyltransferase/oxidoreductase domain-containing protein
MQREMDTDKNALFELKVGAIQREKNPLVTDSQHLAVTAGSLGSADFRKDYGIKYAYLAGAMYKGIASKELVVALGEAGLMGYFGTGGLGLEEIESAILFIQKSLRKRQSYGFNLLANIDRPDVEMKTVELFLRYRIKYIEAAAFMQLSPALVRYRLAGASRFQCGDIHTPNHVLAKVSRPEIAGVFMRPAPDSIIEELFSQGYITKGEAELASEIPIAQDICVESDSGGHTDGGNSSVLMPAMRMLRDKIAEEQSYARSIRIGAAGGIGTPEAAVAAFMLGADFILTGSINQCTVEAGVSASVKDILQKLDVQDTGYAPAGDMFELGAKVQVVKRGTLFQSRANKLYDLYLHHNSLDEIDEYTKNQIQDRYFGRSFSDIWAETQTYYEKVRPEKLADIRSNPKKKMALIFRWYFIHSARLAMNGIVEHKVNYQIHCGPALGAFNTWVKGTELENWRNRNVAVIGEHIMNGTAQLLSSRIAGIVNLPAT